jgi:hypothetical protein
MAGREPSALRLRAALERDWAPRDAVEARLPVFARLVRRVRLADERKARESRDGR